MKGSFHTSFAQSHWYRICRADHPEYIEPRLMLVFGQNRAHCGLRILSMMKKRLSVEQVVGVLKQAEVVVPVAELIRKVGISEQTSYR
jgi:hypothetical protein